MQLPKPLKMNCIGKGCLHRHSVRWHPSRRAQRKPGFCLKHFSELKQSSWICWDVTYQQMNNSDFNSENSLRCCCGDEEERKPGWWGALSLAWYSSTQCWCRDLTMGRAHSPNLRHIQHIHDFLSFVAVAVWFDTWGVCLFKTGSHCVALVGLELTM